MCNIKSSSYGFREWNKGEIFSIFFCEKILIFNSPQPIRKCSNIEEEILSSSFLTKTTKCDKQIVQGATLDMEKIYIRHGWNIKNIYEGHWKFFLELIYCGNCSWRFIWLKSSQKKFLVGFMTQFFENMFFKLFLSSKSRKILVCAKALFQKVNIKTISTSDAVHWQKTNLLFCLNYNVFPIDPSVK